MDQQTFLNLLQSAAQNGVSDVHLQVGAVPGFRLKGDLVSVKSPPLTDADLDFICKLIVSKPEAQAEMSKSKDYDGSFEVKGLCRFRFNIFMNRGHRGIIMRLIPANVPTVEKLGLPPVLKTIAGMHRGLVLVTGATGSGKSSTLAAMIDHINSTQPFHILTIEDPVEFVHQTKKSRITQREIGPDAESFALSLRAALRQDPDIILVGEMRDAETIDIALKAAETGHMVFSTVHTTDAIKTIGRLIAVFPPEEQRIVRMRLADNLAATVSQRLLAKADGKGMVAAQEIMVVNSGIRDCIADPNRTGEINDYIEKSRETSGGQTFEQCLVGLFQQGVITLEEAKSASTNPADLERNLLYGTAGNSAGAKGHSFAEEELALDLSEEDQAKQNAKKEAKKAAAQKADAKAEAPAAPPPLAKPPLEEGMREPSRELDMGGELESLALDTPPPGMPSHAVRMVVPSKSGAKPAAKPATPPAAPGGRPPGKPPGSSGSQAA